MKKKLYSAGPILTTYILIKFYEKKNYQKNSKNDVK